MPSGQADWPRRNARTTPPANQPLDDSDTLLACTKISPVEVRSRIRFAASRYGDIRVTDTILDRIGAAQHPGQLGKCQILRFPKWQFIRALEFHANCEIVAAVTAMPARSAGMPGSHAARYELDQLAVPAYQKMRRNTHTGYSTIVRMRPGIETIREKFCNCLTTKTAWRQTDAMNDKQIDIASTWARVAIWRTYLSGGT